MLEFSAHDIVPRTCAASSSLPPPSSPRAPHLCVNIFGRVYLLYMDRAVLNEGLWTLEASCFCINRVHKMKHRIHNIPGILAVRRIRPFLYSAFIIVRLFFLCHNRRRRLKTSSTVHAPLAPFPIVHDTTLLQELALPVKLEVLPSSCIHAPIAVDHPALAVRNSVQPITFVRTALKGSGGGAGIYVRRCLLCSCPPMALTTSTTHINGAHKLRCDGCSRLVVVRIDV